MYCDGQFNDVCLSVCTCTYLKDHTTKLHEIFCTVLTVAVAQSSDDSAVRYVMTVQYFEVLWMTSCLLVVFSQYYANRLAGKSISEMTYFMSSVM